MSHFVVMVIGEDAEDQLSPYDEGIEVDEYCNGPLTDEDKKRMLDYYNGKGGVDYKTFDECYEANGDHWDGEDVARTKMEYGANIHATIRIPSGIGTSSEAAGVEHSLSSNLVEGDVKGSLEFSRIL